MKVCYFHRRSKFHHFTSKNIKNRGFHVLIKPKTVPKGSATSSRNPEAIVISNVLGVCSASNHKRLYFLDATPIGFVRNRHK